MREPIYHVIFKILNDDNVVRDYCRDEPPLVSIDESPYIRFPNETETKRWADKQLQIHKLHSYEIQYW